MKLARPIFSVWLACCVLQLIAATTEAQWGTVTGRVVFEGDLLDARVKPHLDDVPVYAPISLQKSQAGIEPRILRKVANQSLLVDDESGGVANVLVYLKGNPSRVHPALATEKLEPLPVECRNDLFHPRVLIARTGQTIRMTSRGENTNFHVEGTRNSLNPLVTPQTPVEWSPPLPEPLPCGVSSNVHRSARAWWLIVAHPYATRTDEHGRFRIENLPAGEIELVVWHETVGYVARRVRVAAPANQVIELPTFKITPAMMANR